MKRKVYIVEEVIYQNLREVASAYEGCKYGSLVKRLNRGIPIYDAVFADRWTPNYIPFEGKIYSSVEKLAATTCKNSGLIKSRLQKGWLLWLAVKTPAKYLIDDQEFDTLSEVANHCKINASTLNNRILRKGMRLYDAVYYGRPVRWGGVTYHSRKAMCENLEIPYSQLSRELYGGKSLSTVVPDLLASRQALKQKRMQIVRSVIIRLTNEYHDKLEASFVYMEA